MSQAAPPSSLTHSLINWLALSGVSTEESDLQRMLGTPAFEEAAPSILPPLQNPKLSFAAHLPEFNALEQLNAHFQSIGDLALRQTASHTLLGMGCSANPLLMVIADAPDQHEDVTGLGFSGAGNGLIKKALAYAGLHPDYIYFTYLSKWRPPGQRALSSFELQRLVPLMEEEIRLVQPKAILTLGETVCRSLNQENTPQRAITNKINFIEKQYLKNKIPLFPSHKGEFLVKNPSMKKGFWLGLLALAEAIQPDG